MAEGARPRILVAEDNLVNQRIITNMLDRLGYDADVVENGVEAVDAASRGDYVAVLMDCHMPEMDGMQAAQKIRANDAGSARIPIIAVTANAVTGEKERCIAAGMDDYLAKPLRMQALENTLASWIRREGATRTAAEPDLGDRVIDREQMMEWAAGDVELIREAAELLTRDCRRMLGIAATAIAEKNSAELARAAHNIKGGVGNFGARRAHDAALRMEKIGKSDGNLTGADEALRELRDEVERVITALDNLDLD